MPLGMYTVSPTSLYDHREHTPDPLPESHPLNTAYANVHNHPVTPADSTLLSPNSSHLPSSFGSPLGNLNTPIQSTSTIRDLSSDLSDYDGILSGVNFQNPDSRFPAFLELPLQDPENVAQSVPRPSPPFQPLAHDDDRFLSIGCLSFEQEVWPDASNKGDIDLSIGPTDPSVLREPSGSLRPGLTLTESTQSAPQLTADTNGGGWSSDDNLAQGAITMNGQSPRVTVSYWGREDERAGHQTRQPFAPKACSPRTGRTRLAVDDVMSTATAHGSTVSRDTRGQWLANPETGQCGLAPEDRPAVETWSANELDAERQVREKNEDVAEWVSRAYGNATSSTEVASPTPEIDNVPAGEVPLGDATENRHVPGQAYYRIDVQAGGLTAVDLEIMQRSRNWADAPLIHPISQVNSTRRQPESSQAAIEQFERMYGDTGSVISRTATWGTRRRSLPSVFDPEEVISGNIFKKLSIRGESSHRPSLWDLSRKIARMPSASQLHKRKGSTSDETLFDGVEAMGERRKSRDSLAPPGGTSSWVLGKKTTPSLNTAIMDMSANVASIATSHARTGSISTTAVTSPRSPYLPAVKNPLRRPRSKTDLPKNLVGMLKQAGGPPVARLTRSQPTHDQDDDDDDEDDETFDDEDTKVDMDKMEEVDPTFAGFQEHVKRLNPNLPIENSYLVERIAHQMIVRYKALQSMQIAHLNCIKYGTCDAGPLCITQGGSAMPVDSKGDIRGMNPLSARPDSSDSDKSPLEGAISNESFPLGIPMPPTSLLPAEFECQLCFKAKKFQKPSDWTKHVHEDVQPFTCTWDKCRDPKMFKRKADWVRHENEGHRHLEWWTCDVDDCRHVCYRRDNFLQHLVREHKFREPKIKTKAAIKRAGGSDQTWQRVEKCHSETPNRPIDEKCRFCGKILPTWKKLTVHLAKHMEQISLPVLRLVSSKDLNADTVISPVQDPPPRSFPAASAQQEPMPSNSQHHHAFSSATPLSYNPQSVLSYQNVAAPQVSSSYYTHQPTAPYENFAHSQASGLVVPQAFHHEQYQPLTVTTGPSFAQTASAFLTMDNFPLSSHFGVHDSSGGQLSYNGMADPTVEPYGSTQSSASPFGHSTHQGTNGFNY